MSRKTLAEFEPLLAGEETLLAGLSSGEDVRLGDGDVPPVDVGPERQLRGEFLRYLLLGGCDELAGYKDYNAYVHEKGLRVGGALIIDVLNLESCSLSCDIGLFYCRFVAVPVFQSAVLDNLFLSGSHLPGLWADRLVVNANVFLRNVVAKGEIRFLGARLGGSFDCDGAKLTTLNLTGARIEGMFFLRGEARISGVLDLTDAQFATLNDDEACWPPAGGLVLDRCQYGAITSGPVTAKGRIEWLGRQDEARRGIDFRPQPWEQCAKVLREMGHREDARAILIEKEKRQRADRRKRLWDSYMREDYYGRVVWDTLLAITVRYGHRPLLAFVWLIGLWAIGVGVFGRAEQHHAIKPNDVRILRAAEWVACASDYQQDEDLKQPAPRNETGRSQLACFLDQPEAASYPRFNSLIYSADTLLPIVAMEMQSYWIPDDSDRGVGMWARRYLWLQIIMGWALSLLAVAGFSGLIKSD